MGKHGIHDIRNVCLVGHADAGKTTLADHLLFKCGAVSRLGSVKDKSSVFDFDELEKEKQHSIDSALAHCEWQGKRINLIDTPGYPDFVGDAITAISAVDGVFVCVNAANGVQVNTRRVFDAAQAAGRATGIIVTKCDSADADVDGVLADVREWFGDKCHPVTIPDGFGAGFEGTRRILKDKGGDSEQGKQFYEEFIESAVVADDDVMAAYLEGEEIDAAEIRRCVILATNGGLCVPIIFTSMEKGIGLEDVLDTIVDLFPSPHSATARASWETAECEGDGEPLVIDESGPFYGRIFKVQVDRHVGKISFMRVLTGTVSAGDQFHNASGRRKEKIGNLVEVMGKDHSPVDSASAGDIVALTKIDTVGVGDTLSSEDTPRFLKPIPIPTPMASLAVRPASRNDETKIGEALNKLAAEMPTFTVHRDATTSELIASGMTQLQLDMAFKRLKERYGIDVETSPARIPYRETITAPAEGHYRHKKQSGGRGQFGEVFLRVKPGEPGTGLAYNWDIVGGKIPSNFAPAIEKGIREKMSGGVIAGYPIYDIDVSVYEGKFHDVDSSEAAFKIAGGRAFADAVQKARPALLEPIVEAEISVPSDNMGDVSGDLNTRRGRIHGMDAKGSFQVIKAVVPRAEMSDYTRILTSITSGEGSFSYEEIGYEQVPPNVQADIVAAFKPQDEDD